MPDSATPRQNCNFAPNILVNNIGVREEKKNGPHPVDVRSPEESGPGRSEVSLFSPAGVIGHIQVSEERAPLLLRGACCLV